MHLNIARFGGDPYISRIQSIPPARRPHLGSNLDGWVPKQTPAAVFAAGKESPVPLLFGTTTRELGLAPMQQAQLLTRVERWSGALSPRVLATYRLSSDTAGVEDPKYGSGRDQLGADLTYRCPEVLEATWHSAAQQPVYEYELDHAIPGQPFFRRAFHGTARMARVWSRRPRHPVHRERAGGGYG